MSQYGLIFDSRKGWNTMELDGTGDEKTVLRALMGGIVRQTNIDAKEKLQ